jgi:hypothetical protein
MNEHHHKDEKKELITTDRILKPNLFIQFSFAGRVATSRRHANVAT